MDDSILTSIKAALGLQDDYTAFDFEITMHINSAIATLSQLGVGSHIGYSITDKEQKWADLLLGAEKLNNARSYVFLRVKMLFDASSMTQHVVNAYLKMIDEEAWRLQVAADPMIPQLVPDIDDEDI